VIKELESAGDDIDGSPTPDGKGILFYSNREGGLGGYDLYLSPIEGETVGAPQNLGAPLNTEFEEFDPNLSPDSNTLFFTSNRHSGKDGEHDIYTAVRTGDRWSAPQRLSFNTGFNEWEPALAPDGKTLYFTSDRPGGLGGFDVWMSRFMNGRWQSAVNLGVSVNSPRNEFDPAPTPDGATLYFSTNREEGGEAFDIWQVKRTVD